MKLITILYFAILAFLSSCTETPSQIDDGFLGGITFSSSQSSVTASAASVVAGSSVTVTLSAKDQNGNAFYIPNSSPVVVFSHSGGTSNGTFSSVTDSENGTFTTTFTGTGAGTPTLISATIDGKSINSTTSVEITTPPPPPGAFTLSSATAGASSVVLNWGTSSNATTYAVKFGTSSGVHGTTFSSNATSPTTVTGLTPGTLYYFMVTATNVTGSTDATAQSSATPLSSFTITSATPGSRSVTVAWANATGATSYDVLYGTSSGLVSGTYGLSATNVTSGSTLTGLTTGSTYYIRVRANGANGSVLSTNELTAAIVSTISISPTAVNLLKGDSYQFSATGAAPLAYSDAGSGFMNTLTGFYDSIVNFVSSSELVTLTKTDSGETATATVNFRTFATTNTDTPTFDASFVANKIIRVGTTLYAAGSALGWWIVRKSTDDGTTWSMIDQYRLTNIEDPYYTPAGGNNEARDIAIKGTDLYVVGSIYSGASGSTLHWIVRKSTDSGATWATVDNFNLASERAARANAIFVSGSAIYVAGMANNSSNKRTAIVRKSTDDGASFGANFSTSELSISSYNCQEFNAIGTDGTDIVVGGFFRPSSTCMNLSNSVGEVVDSSSIFGLARRFNGTSWTAVTNSTGKSIRSMTNLAGTLYVAHVNGGLDSDTRSDVYVSTYNAGVLTDHSTFNLSNAGFNVPFEINNDGTNLYLLGVGEDSVADRDKAFLLKYNTGLSTWQQVAGFPAYTAGTYHTLLKTGAFYGTNMIVSGRSNASSEGLLIGIYTAGQTAVQNGSFQFKSTDTGASFSAAAFTNTPIQVKVQTELLRFANTLYEFSTYSMMTSPIRFRRSSDSGATWTVLNTLPANFANPRIDASGNLFGSRTSGTGMTASVTLWRSTDGGETFSSQTAMTPVNVNSHGSISLQDYLVDSGTAYLAILAHVSDGDMISDYQNYLLKSTNNGTSYTSVDLGTGSGSYVKIFKIATGTFLRTVKDVASTISTDSGATWSASTLPSTNFVDLNTDSNGHIYAIYKDTAAKTWVVRKSTDAGSTWSLSDTFQQTGGLQSSPSKIAFAADHSVYVFGVEENANSIWDRTLARKLAAGSSSWRTIESYQEVANQSCNTTPSPVITSTQVLYYSHCSVSSSMIPRIFHRTVTLP